MRFNRQLIHGITLMALLVLAPLSAKAAAALSSAFSATAAGVDVVITNHGADALYNVSVQAMGPGIESAAAPISIGAIAAGGTATFQISGVAPAGYMVFNGSATDVAGQTVDISVVSEGR